MLSGLRGQIVKHVAEREGLDRRDYQESFPNLESLVSITSTPSSSNNNRVPVPISPLDDAADVARDPPAVEVARLRLDLLAVDEAVPGPGVEGEVVPDGGEGRRGPLVGPDAVRDPRRPGCRVGGGPVGRCALPLAVRLARRLGEGDLDGRRGEVVCCSVAGWVSESTLWVW